MRLGFLADSAFSSYYLHIAFSQSYSLRPVFLLALNVPGEISFNLDNIMPHLYNPGSIYPELSRIFPSITINTTCT